MWCSLHWFLASRIVRSVMRVSRLSFARPCGMLPERISSIFYFRILSSLYQSISLYAFFFLCFICTSHKGIDTYIGCYFPLNVAWCALRLPVIVWTGRLNTTKFDGFTCFIFPFCDSCFVLLFGPIMEC